MATIHPDQLFATPVWHVNVMFHSVKINVIAKHNRGSYYVSVLNIFADENDGDCIILPLAPPSGGFHLSIVAALLNMHTGSMYIHTEYTVYIFTQIITHF